MNSFDGMCALVTGWASGLGAATAVALARGGERVVVNYRASLREAEETADLCRTVNTTVKVVQADVAIDADCRKLAAAASDWGRLDALVNNASATKHVANPADLEALSAEDFHRLYAVNTIGPFQMIRAARSLLEAGAGRRACLLGGQCFDDQRAQRSRLVDRLCGEQSGSQHVDARAGTAAGPLIRVNAVCPGYFAPAIWIRRGGRKAWVRKRPTSCARSSGRRPATRRLVTGGTSPRS